MLNRRETLKAFAAAPIFSSLASVEAWGAEFEARENKRPRVAAVYTSFTYRSHAHVILENFLQPYLFCGEVTDPGVDVVSFYRDQTPDGDMTDAVAKEYGIPVFKTIREALCVGSEKLAVDAVLSIGEHGNYPRNEFGQVMYPRKRFFDEIIAVMKESNRFVPIFNDKHLSYRYDWAQEMAETAEQNNVPFLAGSSVPLAERRPNIEIKKGAKIEEAVSIHGGPVESYDFHALEVLQSMVEHRHGGETGVKRITFYEGEQVYQAAQAGIFDWELVEAAMFAETGKIEKRLESIGDEEAITPHAIVLEYVDGFKATVLRAGRSSTRWNFACRLKNKKNLLATSFYVGPWENRNLFKALSHAIQVHFRTGKPPYPVERTLFVSGILDAAMKARKATGHPLHTNQLHYKYQANDFSNVRENGKSWDIITEDIPQPPDFNNGTPANGKS
ncbi:MAG: hypothetical protein CMJ76_15445 [Planctomycetaceae bacterium]|mgnify:FL=1|nr:hypothetical protein [Planctomycetaceae bacterium]|tara:strand:+ start:4617 stop:5951 length:1335 start_codon:yes stop_codon:yes gene_type:complete